MIHHGLFIGLISIASLPGAALAQEGVSEGAETPIETRALFGDWLRHESLVADLCWVDDGTLMTLENSGRTTLWDLANRTVVSRMDAPGLVDIEAVDLAGGGRGYVLAFAGERPRVELRNSLDARPTWVVDGLLGPLATDGMGERVLASRDGELVLVDLDSGEGRPVFEFGEWSVADVCFDRGELAIVTVNRPKQLGRSGTESEPAASLAVVGAAAGELHMVEPLEEAPFRVVRIDETWTVMTVDGRAWQLQTIGGLEGPETVTPDGLLCTDRGGDRLTFLGPQGRIQRVAEPGRPVEQGEFVGAGASRIERAPDGVRFAVSLGTVVRIVDGAGADRGGARGFSARVSSLEFSSGGERLLAASYDHTVATLDPADGAVLTRDRAAGIVHAATWASVGDTTGRAWVARGGRLEFRPDAEGGGARVESMSFGEVGVPWTDVCATGGRIFAGIAGGELFAVDLAAGEPVFGSRGARGSRQLVAALGDHLLLGGSGLLELSPTDGAMQSQLGDLGAPIESLVLSNGGARAALGLANGAVAVLATGPLEVLETVAVHRGRVQALAIGGEGRRLASIGTNDDELTITDLAVDGTAVSTRTLAWEGPACTALAWSPDGRQLFAGRIDGAIQVYSLAD